jgi:RsiW-degrading membrane proteinase PrsW (M82 family)
VLRPERPAFWVYVIVFVVAIWVLLVQEALFRQISPTGWLLAWGLVLLYAIPLVAAGWFLGLFEEESPRVLLAALLWGAVAAAALAGLANAGWTIAMARLGGAEFAARWGAALTAPWVEETLKGCGVVLIALIVPRAFSSLLDGYLVGAAVGFGFAVVEDVFYSMSVFGGRPGAVFSGFLVRVGGGGLYGHVFYTGLVGVGVAYGVRDARSRVKKVAVGVGCYLAAVAAHFLWNAPFLNLFPTGPIGPGDAVGSLLALGVEALPLVGFVWVSVALVHARQRSWFECVRDEVGGEAFTAEEFEIVRDPRARRASRRVMRARAGRQAESLLVRLQHEQTALARICVDAAQDDPRRDEARRYCASLRSALNAIPGAAPAAPAPPAG